MRAYLPTQKPSKDEKLAVPPALLNFLAPLALRHSHSSSDDDVESESVLASASLTAALKQRVAVLQAENDELGDLLSSKTIAKLHEENKSMKKSMVKLEEALRGKTTPSFYALFGVSDAAPLLLESHTIISSLS